MAWLQRLQDQLIRWHILPNDGRTPLGKYLLKHLPIVLVIFLITVILEHLGYFRGQETYALDAWLNLFTQRSPATIYLVLIDDEDYETLFKGTSPLDPHVVQEGLKAIQLGQPAVIGVDLETSSPQFAGHKWPDAVWMRSASVIEPAEEQEAALVTPDVTLELVRPGIFLGGDGKDQQPNHEGVIETTPRSGPSLFLADSDGLIRRYRHLYNSPLSHPASDEKGFVESLPWAISRAYAEWLRHHGQENSAVAKVMNREEGREAEEQAEEIVMTFGGSRDRFRRINLRSLLEASKQSFWKTNSPLKDSIVLFGGTYSAGRDQYITPAGPRYGVELIAHAVETSLAQGGVREFHHWLAYPIDLLVGVVLLVIFWRFPGKRAFVGTLIAAGLLALAGSILAFNSFAYWFNFLPMVGGLWLHYEWEQRKEGLEIQHELESLRKEVAQLKETSPSSPAPPEPPKQAAPE